MRENTAFLGPSNSWCDWKLPGIWSINDHGSRKEQGTRREDSIYSGAWILSTRHSTLHKLQYGLRKGLQEIGAERMNSGSITSQATLVGYL